MNEDFSVAADPEQIKQFLHGLGLIRFDEYFVEMKKLLKRKGNSLKLTNEQIQRKFNENCFFKDDLSQNSPLICPRKRTSFSPVITRKRGKAIKKRTPSTTTVTVTNEICQISTIDEKSNELDPIDYDQPLDLRLRTNLIKENFFVR